VRMNGARDADASRAPGETPTTSSSSSKTVTKQAQMTRDASFGPLVSFIYFFFRVLLILITICIYIYIRCGSNENGPLAHTGSRENRFEGDEDAGRMPRMDTRVYMMTGTSPSLLPVG